MIRFGTLDYGLAERNALTDLISNDDPQLTMGKKVYEFERVFAKWLGSRYAVLVNSGTSALITALTVYGHQDLKTTALSYCAPWNALDVLQIRHSFKDVENDFVVHANNSHELNYDYLIVHLLGKPSRLDFGIEDVCEALGSKLKGRHLGTLASLGCFSFYVAHQINTIEGGMIVTDNKELYEKCLGIRDNGRVCTCPVCTLKTLGKCSKRVEFKGIERKWVTDGIGYNFRPTEVQGVLGLVKMKKIDKICERRHQIFKRYEEAFGSMREESDEYIVPLAYPVQVKDPRSALAHLLEKGVECRGMFPAIAEGFSNAYRISQKYILIPNHQDLSNKNVDFIIEACKGVWCGELK